ncbi:hypothetical protein [Streptomyces lincolnensis]|uniref:hypothetical protein n=1 Tax=Streptomyces lincolnensis TaxID=1915 RepID=UPI0012601E1E|nr:hypothetical protein GJU35_39640 [Streptomyces lincolnensis]
MTVTPVLISDPPRLNFLGAYQPYTPGGIVETETSDGGIGIGETYGSRDHPDEEIAAVHALAPASRPDAATAPAVVTPAGQNPTREGEQ